MIHFGRLSLAFGIRILSNSWILWDSSLSNVVYVDFKSAQPSSFWYRAELYSFDRQKYCFNVRARSVSEAYSMCLNRALNSGISLIRCIAIYLGNSSFPMKIWQKAEPSGTLIEVWGCHLISFIEGWYTLRKTDSSFVFNHGSEFSELHVESARAFDIPLVGGFALFGYQ